ncbi:MAG: hypothetical protein KDK38_06440, partial [Leptospiraceae bacterium]|nr:hypothetical protein [Leptospiraceae bacterium]
RQIVTRQEILHRSHYPMIQTRESLFAAIPVQQKISIETIYNIRMRICTKHIGKYNFGRGS